MKFALLTILFFHTSICWAWRAPTDLLFNQGNTVIYSLDPLILTPFRNALSHNRHTVFTASHQRHNLSGELSTSCLLASGRYNNLFITGYYKRSGYAVSHSDLLNIHGAIPLDDRWSVGAAAGGTSTRLGEENRFSSYHISVSTAFELSETIALGSILNYSRSFHSIIGARIRISNRSTFLLENNMNGSDIWWTGGLGYGVDSLWKFIIGFRTSPVRPGLALLFKPDRVALLFRTEFHPALGFMASGKVMFVLNRFRK